MTLPEVVLWRVLRARPAGLKFRRQHPVGPYVVDFYCETVRLAVEVDGMAHDMGNNPARDERRDAWLKEQGVAALRLRAVDILGDCDAVILHIIASCQPLHQPAAGPPPLQGGNS